MVELKNFRAVVLSSDATDADPWELIPESTSQATR
jgi:hypothetical protein